jgi:hypothetical protein
VERRQSDGERENGEAAESDEGHTDGIDASLEGDWSLAPAMRILVSGMLAGDPHQGGATWAVLQYVLGLRRLGHDVWVVEPVHELAPVSARYFADVVRTFRLEGRAALLDPFGQTVGVERATLVEAARGADALINVAGMLRDPRLTEPVPARVYLDLDPGFTQHWAAEGIDMGFDGHTHFFTVGLKIGSDTCAVPTCGREWLHTVPPIVLERWPVAGNIRFDGFTTVGNWRSYGTLHVDGVRYGLRAHSVRALIDLPQRTRDLVMPALAIDPAETDDLRALAANGWRLLSAEQLAGTPARYRDFIQSSTAELGIAKEGYVVSRCGWFSDRSACYLASGRPVLLQDTGFDVHLPTGAGLLSYTSVDEAAAGIEAIRGEYERHRRIARELAVDLLDSDKVLGWMLACL